jgi:hypothetical protein
LNSETQTDSAAASAAIENLLNSHEGRVLAAMGLFIGYVCVFFTKIMSFTDMYAGVIGVRVITLLLLLLNKERNLKSQDWWFRSITVVVLTIVLTSPQLYFAWTVSVAEAQSAAEANQLRKVADARRFVLPDVQISGQQITPPQAGGSR